MEDLINRQAAIDALGEAPEIWTDSPEEFAALLQWEMDVTAIKALPSAERKTGRWEMTVRDGRLFRRCTKCGWMQRIDLTSTRGYRYNFRPHCGAEMRGDNNGEMDL